MTMTIDIIAAEVQAMQKAGMADLSRDQGQFTRAAKCYQDAAIMIQRFGPLPEDFIHGGWPWSRQHWQPNRFDAQINITKAAALLVLEFERLDEQAQSPVVRQYAHR
jgi:hypothetical protein